MKGDAYSVRFDAAVAFALAGFRPVWRKAAPVPYITHLFSVTALVGEHGGDEDQMIAAMLHDYLEDIPDASPSEIERQFGERVLSMVVALSDSVGRPRPSWKVRKESYLAKLGAMPIEIKLISCADKLHNCRCLVADHRLHGDAMFDRFAGKRDGTLWYYRGLVQELSKGWSSPLLELLSETVADLHRRSNEPYTP